MRRLVRLQRELLERNMIWLSYWSMRAWQRWLVLADALEAEVYGEASGGKRDE